MKESMTETCAQSAAAIMKRTDCASAMILAYSSVLDSLGPCPTHAEALLDDLAAFADPGVYAALEIRDFLYTGTCDYIPGLYRPHS